MRFSLHRTTPIPVTIRQENVSQNVRQPFEADARISQCQPGKAAVRSVSLERLTYKVLKSSLNFLTK